MGLTKDPLAALRKDGAPERIASRRERVEATMDADARKARDVVREVLRADDPPSVTLTEVALKIAKVTSNPEVSAAIEERADAFLKATDIYQKEELLAPRPIGWLGDATTGQLPGSPMGMPEHKILLAVAWGAMLKAVNEATKVGIKKGTKYKPITLIADPDAADLKAPVEWN